MNRRALLLALFLGYSVAALADEADVRRMLQEKLRAGQLGVSPDRIDGRALPQPF